MSVIDIRHKQIERLTAKLIPILDCEEVEICMEAIGVISAMLATSVLEEFGDAACEHYKADFMEIAMKHMCRV